jgi:hypothetical protein
MIEVTTPDALIDALRRAKSKRIGIDGKERCGKTSLGNAIVPGLGCSLYSLDDYLEKNRGGFVKFLDHARLHAEVSPEDSYVIEGVCLLTSLQHANLTIDTLVYIKCRHYGMWADERELDLKEPIEQYIASVRALAARIDCKPITDFGLAEEVIRYHYAMRPHNSAQIIYFRDECS